MRLAVRASALVSVLALVVLAAGPVGGQDGRGQRRGGIAIIEGKVTSPNNQPVKDARVALLNDSYSPLDHKYTDGSGRFRFRVPAGAYYVEVDPHGKPFARTRERVEAYASPFSSGAGETFYVDVRLEPLANPDAAKVPAGGPAAIFYQDVPEAARSAYEKGRGLLAKERARALAELQRAVEIFPEYYIALEALGSEYVKDGRFDEALPLLARAVAVNASGAGSHYALGVLHYQKGRFEEAVASFTTAARLNSKSANTSLYYGLALFRVKKPAEAERELARAYELGAKGVPDLYLGLATIYAQTNRNDQAVRQLELLLDEVRNLPDEARARVRAKIEELKRKN